MSKVWAISEALGVKYPNYWKFRIHINQTVDFYDRKNYWNIGQITVFYKEFLNNDYSSIRVQ